MVGGFENLFRVIQGTKPILHYFDETLGIWGQRSFVIYRSYADEATATYVVTLGSARRTLFVVEVDQG